MVDLALSRMNQIGDQKQAIAKMETIVKNKDDAPRSMSELIIEDRDRQSEKNVKALFKWTTLAKRSLSVLETSHLLRLEEGAAPAYNIIDEVNGRSKR